MTVPLYLMPLLAAAVTGAAGLAGIAHLHRRPAEEQIGPAPEDHGGLKVIAVGMPGAGKTALLAAMFHTLSRPDRHGTCVRTDPEHPDHRDQLNDLAAHFEDLDAVLPFPTPRGAFPRFALNFDVPDHSTGQPLRFGYLDYSGEHLRDGHRPPGLPEPIASDLAEADIVLGLLDGARLASMMGAGPDDRSLAELRDLFRLLHEHRDKVIQLVVTKWDLLAADGRTLDDVVAWLGQRITRFQDLRRADRDSPVRVIPTSAFGLNGFMAAAGPGRIRRDPSLSWQPYQADLPLGCAISELLEHGIQRLSGGDGAAAFTPASVSPFFAWAVKILGLVTISTDLAGNIQFSLNGNALERYQGLVSGSAVTPPGEPADSRTLQLVLRRCRSMADSLDQAFPTARAR